MDWLLVAGYALVVGLTASGIAASVLELVLERRVRFAEPFMSPAHVWRSAAVLLLAGPFMLCNDGLAAFRSGAVSFPALLGCGVAALAWAAASGIAVMAAVMALTVPML